jgi:hypothetical protein
MGIRHVYLGGNSVTGTEVTISDSWSVTENIKAKSTFEFTIIDLNGATLSGFTEVTFYDGTTYIWGGSIIGISDVKQGVGRLVYSIKAVGYKELVERALVIKGFNNQTIEYMVNYLIDNFFSAYGITAGTISAVTEINRVPFSYKYGHTCLNHLQSFGNYIWDVNKDKELNFHLIGYSTSSNTITDASLSSTINNFERTRDMTNYRNRQYVKGQDRLSILQSNKSVTPTPNSSNREFFTKYKIGLEPKIEVKIGAGNWTTQTVGVKGLQDNESNQWWWSYGSSQITHDENESVLTSSDDIRVTYYGLIPLIIIAQDSDEITSRGYVDAYDYNKNISDTVDAFKYGQNLLEKYANEADNITFSTNNTKLYEVGEQIPVFMTGLRNIDENFLCTECRWSPMGVDQIRYDYTAIDSPSTGGWEEFFEKLVELTRVNVDDNEIVIYSKLEQETINLDGEYNITMITPLKPDVDLYPSLVLTPGTIDDTDTISD